MKFVIVFAALFALAVAGPVSVGDGIVRSESDVTAISHKYSSETENGSKADSEGHLENEGTDHESYVHKGSFSFVADDGVTYTVNYIADENGYQPQGAHLPVGPVAEH